MDSIYRILENAIADCGYWRWWTGESLPDSFQIEFGGVQLYQASADLSRPPCSVFALRFEQVEKIEFLDFDADVQPDWFGALARDEIKPPSLIKEAFALGDSTAADAVRGQAVRAHVHFVGTRSDSPVVAAFKTSQQVGLYVAARTRRLVTFGEEIGLKQVSRLHDEWWQYWRRYWDLIDAPEKLPYDPLCEVVIQAAEGDDEVV